MKIAIASLEKNIKSEISPQAGRAPYYLFFENGKLIKSFKNPFASGGGGAGYGVVKILVDNQVDKVIAGRFGDNMQYALEDAKIKFEEKQGLIKNNLQ